MTSELKEQFARDVEEGLSASPKWLSSQYFYDEVGDELFVKIMHMPEYYLSNCEHEIFREQGSDIVRSFNMNGDTFDLFELGAGDGTKTLELLRSLRGKFRFTYKPIDISDHAIKTLEKRVKNEVPDVAVKGMQGEYFEVLNNLDTKRPKVILFMGSNIGNLGDDRANHFLHGLAQRMNDGDKLLLGVDLKKPREIVLPAYDDAQGYTRQFNLNLLARINRELGGDFDLRGFDHDPVYDEEHGWALSYLLSLRDQEVRIKSLRKTFSFARGERIFTEISRKYDDATIADIGRNTGLKVVARFHDRKKYFADVLFEKQSCKTQNDTDV